jgi:hypothetical protein
MGSLDDLFSLIRKGPELASQLEPFKVNMKSVAQGAKAATFQFPCLISNTIPVDMATTITRTLEKRYTAFTQQWLSLNPTLNLEIDRNIEQYLKKFHQNVNFESSDIINDMNEVTFTESVDSDDVVVFTNKNKNYTITFSTISNPPHTLYESNNDSNEVYLSEYDLEGFPYVGNKKLYTEDNITTGDLMKAAIAGTAMANQRKNDVQTAVNTAKASMPPTVLTDRFAKQANDMVPTAIRARVMVVNGDGNPVQYLDYILGIKAIMHPVKSDDIINNITRAVKNQSIVFRFLRWTTGEISLFKNLILNIDEIKQDVINRNSNKNPWFGRLKRLKEKRFGLRNFTVPKGIIPNSSLIITSYEADYIRDHYGIDVRDPKIARALINRLFLMTFIIVDDSTETVDVIDDSSSQYQTYSLETLEHELSLNSNRLGKEIGRMISR